MQLSMRLDPLSPSIQLASDFRIPWIRTLKTVQRSSFLQCYSENFLCACHSISRSVCAPASCFHKLLPHSHPAPRNSRSSPRPISTSQLNTLLHLHTWPINHVFYMGSYPYGGISHLGVGFTLRCLQRLSLPNLATQLCHWYDNWCTSGSSIPVLSY